MLRRFTDRDGVIQRIKDTKNFYNRHKSLDVLRIIYGFIFLFLLAILSTQGLLKIVSIDSKEFFIDGLAISSMFFSIILIFLSVLSIFLAAKVLKIILASEFQNLLFASTIKNTCDHYLILATKDNKIVYVDEKYKQETNVCSKSLYLNDILKLMGFDFDAISDITQRIESGKSFEIGCNTLGEKALVAFQQLERPNDFYNIRISFVY